MKKSKWYIGILIAVTMLMNMLWTIPSLAQQSTVGYEITGEGEGEDFELRVSIENVLALAGRIAIAFDAEKLELKDTGTLPRAVKAESGVVLSTEGLDTSVLLSNAKGYAMFAWYPSSNAGLDARNGSKQIATIPFRIKSGYSTADFTRSTFGIRFVNSSMVDQWDCGASVVAKGLIKYSNTAGNSEYLCNIRYDYPNCDVVPIITYEAKIKAEDLYGNPIRGAEVKLDSIEGITNASGEADFVLENGIYAYRVEAEGYQTQTGYITVNDSNTSKTVNLKSYEQMVQATANELRIEYSKGDDAANVTSGIGLETSGANGETITWESSDPSVVTTQGIVKRQDRDVNVTMTATITMGTATIKRSFNITVKSKRTAEQTNALIVQMDAEELAIGYAPGDSERNVTTEVTLPESGRYGSTIVWESSNESIIDVYGTVERPSADTNVTLTATIIRGSVNQRRTFTLTVKAAAASARPDAELVEEVARLLSIGYAEGDSASKVTKPITLPIMGTDGVEISWRSSEPAIVTAYGGVVRQFADCEVIMTATITKGSSTLEKVFRIVVKAAETAPINPDTDKDTDIIEKTDRECVTGDKNELRIIYAPGDSSSSVTSNITLPATGANGSSIFWESSDAGVISAYGSVTRAESDRNVTMTAILTKGSITDRATFNLTVKGKGTSTAITDSEAVQQVSNALEIVYANGDHAGHVTKSVTLPTSGANDTKIIWRSSNTNVVGTNGGVTRKIHETTVTLTAVISRGEASAERKFELTILAAEQPSGSSMVNSGEDIEILYPTQAPNATAEPSQQVNEHFTDIGNVPWAKEAILELAKSGVIKGTSETEFSPEDSISRGDFVTLLVRMLNLSSEVAGEGFADVSADTYYYEPITTAKTLGVITGVGENRFEPEGKISRQDMMTMTYRALEKLGMADFGKSDLTMFRDTAEIADYAIESVSYVVGGGLIAGDENGYINPNANTTRAETAVFLYRLYSKN